jgi:hypothetical protein
MAAPYYAISSLETDIILSPEMPYIQLHTNLLNNATIELNNIGNMSREPYIELTLNNDSNSITLINQTINESITITNDIPYLTGTIFKIYTDAVYIDNEEILAVFTAPFIILENTINILKISAGEGVTTDIKIQWIKPSTSQQVMAYMQNFNLTETKTQQRKQVNKLKKYTNGFINQDISYNFTIDHLYFQNYFPSQNPDVTYNVKYQTDLGVGGIQQQTIYLSGVSITNWGISQEEISLVKENVQGTCCKLFLG